MKVKVAVRGGVGINVNYARGDGWFRKGNRCALAKTMDPESHKKRMAALYRGWATRARKQAGEKLVGKNETRLKEKRKRIRMRTTIAKEAREIQDAARTHASAVIEKLADIVENSINEPAIIAASQVLLDRAYGKASQTHINANVNGKNNDITQAELDARIGQALKRVEELTGGKEEAPKSQERPADIRKFDRDPDSSTQH